MQLNQFDVEDLANARVNRQEKKSTDKWFYGMCVGLVVGFIIGYAFNIWAGGVVCICAVVGFLYYNSKLTKKKNNYKLWLFKEWEKENKTKVS